MNSSCCFNVNHTEHGNLYLNYVGTLESEIKPTHSPRCKNNWLLECYQFAIT